MRSSGSKRSWRLAVVMLLVLAALAIAAPAALAQDGFITGQITEAAGSNGIGDIWVIAHSLENGTEYWTQTSPTGAYMIQVPGATQVWEPKLYEVEARQDGPLQNVQWNIFNYIPGWYSVAPPAAHSDWDATPVAIGTAGVVAGFTTADIDIALYWRGGIYGNVSDSGAADIEGVEVYIWNPLDPPYDTTVELVRAARNGSATPDDITDADGDYFVTGLLPTETGMPSYYWVFFHDPSGQHADMWFDSQEWWDPATDVELPYSANGVWALANQQLPDTGSLGGEVEMDNGYGHWDDAPGVIVELYSWFSDQMLANTVTGWDGHYDFWNVPPGYYEVRYLPCPTPADIAAHPWYADYKHNNPHGNPGYYNEWYNNEPEPWINGEWAYIASDSHTHGVDAYIDALPEVWWLHPPFGANDGPDRYNTVVTFNAWGTGDLLDISLLQEVAVNPREIFPNPWFTDEGAGEAHFNLASPKAPADTYSLVWYWFDPFDGVLQSDYTLSAFQVVESWVPTTPVTPPTPGATPTTPATPTPTTPDPVVTPTPEPTTPAPVAGPVTVTASKASVKRGALATLRFQVNESVLGGTTDVKIIVKSKAGKVVKTVNARGVTMNSAASISFRCKLAKGSYTYTVDASGVTASSTLSVR